MADRGHPLAAHDPTDSPSKFHIPLTMKGRINTIGSQTDIATTVLDQLHVSTRNLPWGKDLPDSAAKPFAFYSFNNGFGLVAPKETETMDNVAKRPVYVAPGYDTSQIKFGKAYIKFFLPGLFKQVIARNLQIPGNAD